VAGSLVPGGARVRGSVSRAGALGEFVQAGKRRIHGERGGQVDRGLVALTLGGRGSG